MAGARTIHELRSIITSSIDGFVQNMNSGAASSEKFAKAWDQAGKDVRASVASIDKAITRTSLALAGLAAGAVVVVRKFTSAAETQIEAERKLENAIQQTGNAAGIAAEAVFKFASARQAVTNFGDEVTIAAAGIVSQFKNIQGEAFYKTLTLAQDMAAKLGKDLPTAAKALAIALEDPTKAARSLRSAGVILTQTEKEQIEAFANAGRTAEAQAIIFQAVESRMGGAALALAKPWTILMNTLGDLKENIGFALLPALNSVSNMLLGLLMPITANREGFEAWGVRLAAFVNQYKPAIESFLVDAATYIRDMTQAAIEQGPYLIQLAGSWLSLLSPIFEFLKAHPEVVAAFLFFKGAQVTGIPQMFFSIAQAAFSLTGALGGTQLVVSALASAGLPALAVALGVIIGKILYEFNPAIRDLNREIERAKGLDAEIADRQAADQNKILAGVRGAADPAAAARAQLAAARANATQAKSQAAGAKANAANPENFRAQWNDGVIIAGIDRATGGAFNQVKAGLEKEAAQAEQKARSAARFVATLENELALAEARANRGPLLGAAPGGALPGDVLTKAQRQAAAKDEKADARQAAKEQRDADRAAAKEEHEAAKRLAETNDAMADFNRKLDDLRGSLSPEQAANLQAAVAGVNAQYREGDQNSKEYRNSLAVINEIMKNMTAISDARRGFVHKFDQHDDDLKKAGADQPTRDAFRAKAEALAGDVEKLSRAFDQDKITLKQFNEGMKELNQSLTEAEKDAMAVVRAQTQMDKSIADHQQEMQEQIAKGHTSSGTLTFFNQITDGIKNKLAKLGQQLQAGTIDEQQFTLALEELRQEFKAATKAAQEHEKAEKRAMMMRLLSGEGTPEDMQRLQMMQNEAFWSDFDQQLTQQFNSVFMPIQQAAGDLAGGFNNLNQGIQVFGDNINGMFGTQGNAPSPGEAWGQIQSFLNSKQGIIASLYNNISLLQQAMQYAGGQERVALQKQIASLQQQLANATKPVRPLISGASLEFSGRGIGQQNNRFELNFPNWSPQSQFDIRYLAEAVGSEIVRRGRQT